MFLMNVGWKWSIVPERGPHGVIFNASGVDLESALRRERPSGLPDEVYFDPQLYLLSLPYDTAPRTCRKLATYPWFPIETPDFDSGEVSIRDWIENVGEAISERWPPVLPSDPDAINNVIRQSIDFQQQFGVSEIILPSPLTNFPESDLSVEMTWVDEGIRVASAIDKPFLVTFAISDACLLHVDPSDNQLLQLAIDQFTAREEIPGVYLVIEHSRGESNRIVHARVAWALLEFCYYVGKSAGKKVLVNYTDTFGLACLAAGAKGFASGLSTKSKRLHFEDFVERGGGGAFPKFYAHSTICDYLPERDLERLRDLHLLRLIQNDRTPASSSLFDVLTSGGSVGSIPEWRESKNNLSGSRDHFIQRVRTAVDQINGRSENEKREIILAWLQDAERTVNYLNERFSDEALYDDGRHVRAWRSAFESFLNQHP
jgi:hypothetical protein